MDDQSRRDKIIDKITKAIALSESEKHLGHLEAAENAASIASRLMLEYGIDQEVVSARASGKDKIGMEPAIPAIDDFRKAIRETPWTNQLAAIVAKAFNCRILIPMEPIQKKYGYNSFLFVGYVHERKQAVHFYTMLFRALDEAVDHEYRKAFRRAYQPGTVNPVAGTEWRKSFLIGALNGLITRFNQIRGDVIARAADPGMALVRLNQTLEAIDQQLANIASAEQKPIVEPGTKMDRSAIHAGHKWAQEVPLLTTLEQNPTKHVLPKN